MNFNQPVAVSICTRILKYQFEKSSLMNSFFCLFQTRILQATQAVKTEFKLDRNFISSNSIFQNPSADRYRMCDYLQYIQKQTSRE